jgi:hypothetical protein
MKENLNQAARADSVLPDGESRASHQLNRCKNLLERLRNEMEEEDDENYWISKLGLAVGNSGPAGTEEEAVGEDETRQDSAHLVVNQSNEAIDDIRQVKEETSRDRVEAAEREILTELDDLDPELLYPPTGLKQWLEVGSLSMDSSQLPEERSVGSTKPSNNVLTSPTTLPESSMKAVHAPQPDPLASQALKVEKVNSLEGQEPNVEVDNGIASLGTNELDQSGSRPKVLTDDEPVVAADDELSKEKENSKRPRRVKSLLKSIRKLGNTKNPKVKHEVSHAPSNSEQTSFSVRSQECERGVMSSSGLNEPNNSTLAESFGQDSHTFAKKTEMREENSDGKHAATITQLEASNSWEHHLQAGHSASTNRKVMISYSGPASSSPVRSEKLAAGDSAIGQQLNSSENETHQKEHDAKINLPITEETEKMGLLTASGCSQAEPATDLEEDANGLDTLEENSQMILQQFASLKSVFEESRAHSSALLQNVFQTSWGNESTLLTITEIEPRSAEKTSCNLDPAPEEEKDVGEPSPDSPIASQEATRVERAMEENCKVAGKPNAVEEEQLVTAPRELLQAASQMDANEPFASHKLPHIKSNDDLGPTLPTQAPDSKDTTHCQQDMEGSEDDRLQEGSKTPLGPSLSLQMEKPTVEVKHTKEVRKNIVEKTIKRITKAIKIREATTSKKMGPTWFRKKKGPACATTMKMDNVESQEYRGKMKTSKRHDKVTHKHLAEAERKKFEYFTSKNSGGNHTVFQKRTMPLETDDRKVQNHAVDSGESCVSPDVGLPVTEAPALKPHEKKEEEVAPSAPEKNEAKAMLLPAGNEEEAALLPAENDAEAPLKLLDTYNEEEATRSTSEKIAMAPQMPFEKEAETSLSPLEKEYNEVASCAHEKGEQPTPIALEKEAKAMPQLLEKEDVDTVSKPPMSEVEAPTPKLLEREDTEAAIRDPEKTEEEAVPKPVVNEGASSSVPKHSKKEEVMPPYGREQQQCETEESSNIVVKGEGVHSAESAMHKSASAEVSDDSKVSGSKLAPPENNKKAKKKSKKEKVSKKQKQDKKKKEQEDKQQRKPSAKQVSTSKLPSDLPAKKPNDCKGPSKSTKDTDKDRSEKSLNKKPGEGSVDKNLRPPGASIRSTRRAPKKMLSWREDVEEKERAKEEAAASDDVQAVIWWSASKDAVEVLYEDGDEKSTESDGFSAGSLSYGSLPTALSDDHTFDSVPHIDFSFSTLKEVTSVLVEEASIIGREMTDAGKDMLAEGPGMLRKWLLGGGSSKKKRRKGRR